MSLIGVCKGAYFSEGLIVAVEFRQHTDRLPCNLFDFVSQLRCEGRISWHVGDHEEDGLPLAHVPLDDLQVCA
jgi:hypothetical protein